MTDRELLEAAAKAAGISGWQSKHGYWNLTDINGEKVTCCHGWGNFDQYTGKPLNPTFADAVAELNWNPLTDDGDALRLAVKLGIEVTPFNASKVTRSRVLRSIGGEICEAHEGDPYAATRRAIVRAAAEIGAI